MPSPTTAQALPIYLVPLHCLHPAPWNMTKPSKRSLNLLAQNIKEIGFAETALIVPQGTWAGENGRVLSGEFRIVSGHDKTLAASIAGLTEIPCSILPEETTEEMQKLQTVRMNTIHKELDPNAFKKLYDEMVKKYSAEVVEAYMMFSNEEDFKKILKQNISDARKELPTEEMKEEFDAKKPKIKSVDDLANVVQELYTKTGSTSLDKGYTVFSYGNQEHIYIAMDKELNATVRKLIDKAAIENRHITEIFKEALDNDNGDSD
jgi:ParB-like chromosome segregation protein Spo0J